MKKMLLPIVIIAVALIGFVIYLVIDLQTIIVDATVKTDHIQNIMIDFPAFIKEVYVKEGQRVEKGDPLLMLDLNEYNSRIVHKEQEMVMTRSTLHEEEANAEQIAADLGHAEEVLRTSQRELRDKESLFRQGVISKYDLDEIQNKVRADQNAVDHLRLALKAKREGTASSGAINQRLSDLSFELQSLKVKYNLNNIRGNRILAPISGVVQNIGYKSGDIMDEEIKVLSILDLAYLYVEANVPEALIKDIKPGNPVIFTPVADLSKEYKGRVIEISGVAVLNKNGETVLPVKIRINKPDRFLVLNLNGKVRFLKK